jgi:hypothetical protein
VEHSVWRKATQQRLKTNLGAWLAVAGSLFLFLYFAKRVFSLFQGLRYFVHKVVVAKTKVHLLACFSFGVIVDGGGPCQTSRRFLIRTATTGVIKYVYE